jgi:hypothetical protein
MAALRVAGCFGMRMQLTSKNSVNGLTLRTGKPRHQQGTLKNIQLLVQKSITKVDVFLWASPAEAMQMVSAVSWQQGTDKTLNTQQLQQQYESCSLTL